MHSKLMVAWMPPPELTISEWADEKRYLSPEASAEPGKWDTSRAEYQRKIMDAISDDNIEEIIIISSSQIGKTEIINNVVGYYIEQDSSPMLVVQPTLRPMAEAWSKDRLAPMLRDTPCLHGKVKDAKSKDSENTILHKTFPGGHITVSGANSPASLASRPIRILLLDEIDRYPASAGTEGDPSALAIKRTATFWNRKIVKTSTPTIKDFSRIEMDFLETDQRRFFIPCLHCGEYQYLKFGNVIWNTDDKGTHYPETAIYACEKCGAAWDDPERWEAVKKGEWRATAKSKSEKKTGFHIWSAYSPWVYLEDMVRDFLFSKNDRELLKVFTNTVLGESFEDYEAEGISSNALFSRRKKYSAECPADVLVLTCSADIQKDRIEIETKGWGIGERCWGIEYSIIHGNTDIQKTWDDLNSYLLKKYEHESGVQLPIACATIDSGYRTDWVYKFCRKMSRQGRRVYAVKGKGDAGRPITARPSKVRNYNIKLFTIGTNNAKERLMSRLNVDEPGPGYMHFNRSYDSEYFDQLLAERPIKKYIKGFPVLEWHKKPNVKNEALDITVYNFAALEILNPNFEALARNLKTKTKSENKPVESEPESRTNKSYNPKRSKKGYLNGWR